MRISCFGVVLPLAVVLSACDSRTVSIEKIAGHQPKFSGVSYFLPKGLVDLTISSKKPADGAKAIVTLTVGAVRYVADPSHHYAVTINHDVFYTDKIVVQVGKNGLLESISSDSKDETGEIIRRIVRAPLEILGEEGERQEIIAGKYNTFDIKMTLDPTDVEDRARLDTMLRQVLPTIRFRARPLARLPGTGSRIHSHPDCNINPCFRVAIPYALELVSDPKNSILEEWTTTQRRETVPPTKGKGPPTPPAPEPPTPTATRSSDTSVTASADAQDGLVVARAVVLLPSKHVVGQIALTRAPFVQKKFNLTFTDGLLTKADLDNPSEVLAFVQIPIEVAKAIVAIPSALFNFQVRQVQADNKLLQAQKQNLEYQKQIIDAQKALLLASQ